MWYEVPPTGNPRMHGVVPSYGTLRPSQRYLLGDPFWTQKGPFEHASWKIVSKWSFRLVGNTPFLDPLQMEVLRWCGGPHER